MGQLLMVHFHGEEVNEEARTLVQKIKVGGIVYYNWANSLHSPEQVKALSAGLQELAEIPLLIAVDQEGGRVARLRNGFTQFPGNKAIGETGEPQRAYDAALTMGKEMRAVGINMNLAPVVDVNSNPCNPIIGDRSFGAIPEVVALFAEQALSGYRDAHEIATLKHFPGHGDVDVDSHEDLPVIRKTKEELEECELAPFAALASFAPAIMTAHLLVPALDRENCCTLSEKSLSYLRDVIGFQGVIITDSLVMKAILKTCRTVDEAAIRALQAGADVLLIGGRLLHGESAGFEMTVADVGKIHRSIVAAVKTGRISEERINTACQRILDLKKLFQY
ncbi:MAG: beta-N-acetylhexosaminidase [Verrucomicrobiota bacterium]|nr:beta-N-acetylhexosaminidase [Verrucomicrobiota bacterium]